MRQILGQIHPEIERQARRPPSLLEKSEKLCIGAGSHHHNPHVLNPFTVGEWLRFGQHTSEGGATGWPPKRYGRKIHWRE
uniref:Uncharacterized protein n=1 Tax=Cereibacter sphaeroides (strain ATCC 17025 / ATH 2.4.3) TaxID=349102 RepID=A4WTB8_CERS5